MIRIPISVNPRSSFTTFCLWLHTVFTSEPLLGLPTHPPFTGLALSSQQPILDHPGGIHSSSEFTGFIPNCNIACHTPEILESGWPVLAVSLRMIGRTMP